MSKKIKLLVSFKKELSFDLDQTLEAVKWDIQESFKRELSKQLKQSKEYQTALKHSMKIINEKFKKENLAIQKTGGF